MKTKIIRESKKGALVLEKDQLILSINGEEQARTKIEYKCNEWLIVSFLRSFFEQKESGDVIGADDFYTSIGSADCDTYPSMYLTDKFNDAFLALGLREEITEFRPTAGEASPLESARLTALFGTVKGDKK